MFEMKLLHYRIRTLNYLKFCYKNAAKECHWILCTALATEVSPYDSVTIWYRKFKNKNYNIQETESFGRSIPVSQVDKTTCQNLWKKVGIQPLESLLRRYTLVPCTVGQRKNETPTFISILIIVQKWNRYPSSWITVYLNLMF